MPSASPPPDQPGRRYGGRDAGERAAERRARLLGAALELMGTQGFHATTIRGLCAAAGLAPRYFYEQFSDREELLRAVYDESIALVLTRVAAAREAAPEGLEPRLRHLLGAFLDAMLEDERRARICYLEVPGVSHAMEEHRRSAVRGFEAMIEQDAVAILGDDAAGRDFGLTSLALAGATNELLQAWLLGDRRPTQEQLADELAALFAASLDAKR